MPSADLPAPGDALPGSSQRGKQLFNSAIGPEGAADNSRRPAGRMSDFGWGTCYSCHPKALTDTVTWMFADGPRQAISMESTFEFGAAVIENGAPKLPDSHQRALNWSAVRDEMQDFTRNIRAVSGGGGPDPRTSRKGSPVLPRSPIWFPSPTPVAAPISMPSRPTWRSASARRSRRCGTTSASRSGRLIFRGRRAARTATAARTGRSALSITRRRRCATEIVDAQLVRFLCRVGTFDPALFTRRRQQRDPRQQRGERAGAWRPRVQRPVAHLRVRLGAVPAQRRGSRRSTTCSRTRGIGRPETRERRSPAVPDLPQAAGRFLEVHRSQHGAVPRRHATRWCLRTNPLSAGIRHGRSTSTHGSRRI